MFFLVHQKESEKSPPTKAVLTQAFRRVHHEATVWNRDLTAKLNLPSLKDFGWMEENRRFIPVMKSTPPAPEVVLQLLHSN